MIHPILTPSHIKKPIKQSINAHGYLIHRWSHISISFDGIVTNSEAIPHTCVHIFPLLPLHHLVSRIPLAISSSFSVSSSSPRIIHRILFLSRLIKLMFFGSGGPVVRTSSAVGPSSSAFSESGFYRFADSFEGVAFGLLRFAEGC
jgi:hypothetical protein